MRCRNYPILIGAREDERHVQAILFRIHISSSCVLTMQSGLCAWSPRINARTRRSTPSRSKTSRASAVHSQMWLSTPLHPLPIFVLLLESANVSPTVPPVPVGSPDQGSVSLSLMLYLSVLSLSLSTMAQPNSQA